jgi:hypothetical protein
VLVSPNVSSFYAATSEGANQPGAGFISMPSAVPHAVTPVPSIAKDKL